jgi:hypothetical protein
MKRIRSWIRNRPKAVPNDGVGIKIGLLGARAMERRW